MTDIEIVIIAFAAIALGAIVVRVLNASLDRDIRALQQQLEIDSILTRVERLERIVGTPPGERPPVRPIKGNTEKW